MTRASNEALVNMRLIFVESLWKEHWTQFLNLWE